MGTDAGAFAYILGTRSWAHIRKLKTEYKAATGNSLKHAISSEFSGATEKALLAIRKPVDTFHLRVLQLIHIIDTVQCAKSRTSYHAQVLHQAVRGIGTHDRDLIRVIVSRCDIDLGDIKQDYEKLYGKSLEEDVDVSLFFN